jgi:hypothetical protein
MAFAQSFTEREVVLFDQSRLADQRNRLRRQQSALDDQRVHLSESPCRTNAIRPGHLELKKIGVVQHQQVLNDILERLAAAADLADLA